LVFTKNDTIAIHYRDTIVGITGTGFWFLGQYIRK
jgi:hypothetical protein